MKRPFLSKIEFRIRVNPQDCDALYHKGRILEKKSNYEVAIQYYNKVLKLNYKHGDAMYHTGKCLEKLGKYKLALDSFEEAADIFKQKEDFSKILRERPYTITNLAKKYKANSKCLNIKMRLQKQKDKSEQLLTQITPTF